MRPNFQIKTDTGLQVDIDSNPESNFFFFFFFQGAVSFHPSVGTQNQPNPRNCFLFYSFGEFMGPSKPSNQ